MVLVVGEVVMDERGRVVIPMEIRKALRLRSEQRFVVEARGEVIVLRPRVDVDEFIAQFKGCISGSRVKASELKEIWGTEHAHC